MNETTLDRIVRFAEAEKITGMSHESIYRRYRDGDFPKPVRIGPGPQMVGFGASELQEWIETRPTVGEE